MTDITEILKQINTPISLSSIPGFQIVNFFKVLGKEDEDIFVNVKFENPVFGINKEVSIPLEHVKSPSKLAKYVPPGFVIERVHPSNQTKVLQKAICSVYNKSDTKAKVMVSIPQGFTTFDGRLYYIVGDTILPKEQYGISEGHKLLAYNPEGVMIKNSYGSSEDAYKWVRTYCSQGEAHATLFLCSLTPYIKYVVEDIFEHMGSVVNAYVTGPSAVGKTSQIKLLSMTEDRFGINLESDLKKIVSFVSNYPDKSLLIDDLNSTLSTSQKDRKEVALFKLIQMTSCGGEIYSGESSIHLENTALLISAEYLLQNASTINRCVVIRINEAFDSDRLSYLQKRQGCFVLFVEGFVTWLCKNQARLAELTHNACDITDFHIANVGPAESYVGFKRIFNSFKVLKTTAFLVSQYFAEEVGVDRRSLFKRFSKSIDFCVKDTLETVRTLPLHRQGHILNAFLNLLEEDKVIAKKPDKYFENGSNRKFFLHSKYLYFKGEYVANCLSHRLGYDVSVKALSSELSSLNLLEKFGGSLSGRLPKKLETKYITKSHYYRVSKAILCDLLESRLNGFELTISPAYKILTQSD